MLKHIPFLSDFDRGDGVCRYLVNNLCSIYNERPSICNVEQMYLSYFKEIMTEKEFIELNIKSCLQIAEYYNDAS